MNLWWYFEAAAPIRSFLQAAKTEEVALPLRVVQIEGLVIFSTLIFSSFFMEVYKLLIEMSFSICFGFMRFDGFFLLKFGSFFFGREVDLHKVLRKKKEKIVVM